MGEIMTDIKDHINRINEEFEEQMFDKIWGGIGTVTADSEPTTITVQDMKKRMAAHLKEIAKSGPIYTEKLVVQGEDGAYYSLDYKSLRYDPNTHVTTFNLSPSFDE